MKSKAGLGVLIVLILFTSMGVTCPQQRDADVAEKYFPGSSAPPPIPSIVGAFHPLSGDTGTPAEFKIVQACPPDWSRGINPRMGLTFFFNDEVDPAFINDSTIRIFAGNGQVTGIYTAVLTPAGFTCLSFIPYQPWPAGQLVMFTIRGGAVGIKDNDGSVLDKSYTYRFSTLANDLPSASANLSFEDGITGYKCQGDCNVMDSPPTSGIIGTNGTKMAFISSGNTPLVSDVASLMNTTSLITSGAMDVPPGMNFLIFDYKMISSEYKEWIGSQFDDSFVASVTGTADGATLGGYYANLIDSVNLTDASSLFPTAYPGMPDEGDTFAGETPWLQGVIPISAMVSPVYATFFVSDVGDTAFTTIVIIDNIRFAP